MAGIKNEPFNQKAAAASLLQDPDSYGVSLYLAATVVLSLEELTEFHPETIKMELEEQFKLRQPIDEEIFGRLVAANMIASTDLFHRDLSSFIEIANVLSGTPPNPEIFDPADVSEIIWAVAESELLNSGDDEITFSEDVRRYIGEMLYIEGYHRPPPLLRMAIMPERELVAEQEGGAEITGMVVSSEQARHQDLRDMLAENMAKLAQQLARISGLTIDEIFGQN